MKKIVLFSALTLIAAASASAQETYENAKLASQDLNGTARYVGMGGALDALGADISTISSNPAGIGLFRHSTANVSFGVVSQQEGKSFANGDKTNMSFDQIGFVYSKRVGSKSFLNFAFNYHKSMNFDYILSAVGRLDGNSSQNKGIYLKTLKDDNGNQVYSLHNDGTNDEPHYLADPLYNNNIQYPNNTYTQIDYLYANALLPVAFDNNSSYGGYYAGYLGANGFMFDRAHIGYIGTYDFNLSGNINDRVYLGITIGIHDVHYRGYSEYTENLVDKNNASIGSVLLTDNRKITGTGFDIKAGVIIRPIEDSPFRLGLSVATPIWYDLTTSNYSTIDNTHLNAAYGTRNGYDIGESYDFKLYTPWKFGFSVGTTFGNYLAVGAGYEYVDYSFLDSRVNDGDSYDWYYDTYYSNSSSDWEMNSHTKNTLKSVSTLKLGMELKPEENLAIRLGYNYVSPMYKETGYKNSYIDSPGSYYASTTDYTNWEATNRITCGIGYTIDKFSFDLAYQYNVQKGRFHAFTENFVDDQTFKVNENICDAVDVNNKRHQILFTLGYHF